MADIETVADWNLQMTCWGCYFPTAYYNLRYRLLEFRIGILGHQSSQTGEFFPTILYSMNEPNRIFYKRRVRIYENGPLTNHTYPGGLDTITMDHVTAEANEYFPEIAQVEYRQGTGLFTISRPVEPERVYRHSGGKITYERYSGASGTRITEYEMEPQEHNLPNVFVIKTTITFRDSDGNITPGNPHIVYNTTRWSTIADSNITGAAPPVFTNDLTEPYTIRELAEEAFAWADDNSPSWTSSWIEGIPSWLSFRTHAIHLKCQINSSIPPNPLSFSGDYWHREWDIVTTTYNDDNTWNPPGSLTGSDSHTYNRPSNPTQIFTYESSVPERKELYNDRYISFRSKYGTKPQHVNKPWPP